MSKYQFSPAERFAVWKHHGATCYICEEPLRLQETTVDHFIPEHLEGKPDQFAEVRRVFSLDGNFKINDFCNWLPCHNKCNQEKGSKPLKPTFKAIGTLEKLARDAETVSRIAQGVIKNAKKDNVLGMLIAAVDADELQKVEILTALADPELPQDEDIQVLRHEIKLCVDQKRWHIVSMDDSRELAFVSDGRMGGQTPTNPNPHISWVCPTCGNNGPWNGVQCLSCGRVSDGWD